MRPVVALALGLVQGLTEFLPVSSSGHLVIMQAIFGIRVPGMAVEMAAHAGTLAAVLTVYGEDAIRIARTFLRGMVSPDERRRPEFREGLCIIVGSIPAGILGIAAKGIFEAMFEGLEFAAVGLLVTGTVLFLAGRRRVPLGLDIGGAGPGGAIVVGLAQAFAIAPGVSRSGLTISTGLTYGLRSDEAARLSFLLSIPVTLGAALLGIREMLSESVPSVGAGPVAIVAGVAFVSGSVALRYLVTRLRSGGISGFAYYCWAAGIAALLVARLRG